MVSALACWIRGRAFESRANHFPQSQIINFFYFLVFPFYFSQFWSKTMCKYILKVWQYWICNGKEAKLFYFSKWQTPHTRAKQDFAWLSSFLFKAQCFYWDEDDLAPDDKYYIRGKRNALWFWQHFGRTITLAVFDIPIVSTESQVLYSFIIKVGTDTPFLYFLIFFW